jgi:hypothetical protein
MRVDFGTMASVFTALRNSFVLSPTAGIGADGRVKASAAGEGPTVGAPGWFQDTP